MCVPTPFQGQLYNILGRTHSSIYKRAKVHLFQPCGVEEVYCAKSSNLKAGFPCLLLIRPVLQHFDFKATYPLTHTETCVFSYRVQTTMQAIPSNWR